MSELLVTSIYNQEGEGAPNFPKGATVTGVITATSFSGSGANLTGIDATALKDTDGNVKIQAEASGVVVTGILTATGSVSVGGTLTYEDVTNIDSVGLITARQGIKVTGGDVQVGTAVTVDTSGVNVTGVVTATSFKGDGSQLTGIDALPTMTGTAYGNIAANKAVQIRSDGQGLETISANLMGWAEEFLINGNESVTSWKSSNMTMIAENKYALVYVDSSANCYGRICTINPDTLVVTLGAAQALDVNGTSSSPDVAWDVGDSKLVYAWMRGSDAKARVCTVSGTTHTLAPTLASVANSVSSFGGVVYEPYRGTMVFSYRYNGLKILGAQCDNTGDWLNFGSHTDAGDVDGSTVNLPRVMCPMHKTTGATNQSGKLAFIFRNGQSPMFGTYWYCVNVNSNGTSVSFSGSRRKLSSNDGSMAMGYGLVRGSNGTDYPLALVLYNDGGNTRGGYEILQIYNDGSTTSANVGGFTANGDNAENMGKYVPYDPVNKRFVLTYKYTPAGGTSSFVSQFLSVDPAVSWTPTLSERTVIDDSTTSVDSVTAIATQGEGSEYLKQTTGVNASPNVADSSIRVITTFQDESNSDYLTSAVLRPATTSNLGENFVGFADTSYTNGQTAKVKVVGNQLTQAGLTTGAQHFVQADGTVGTTPFDPIGVSTAVIAGRAITGNTLLIQPSLS